jgi:hypothetical protein
LLKSYAAPSWCLWRIKVVRKTRAWFYMGHFYSLLTARWVSFMQKQVRAGQFGAGMTSANAKGSRAKHAPATILNRNRSTCSNQ